MTEIENTFKTIATLLRFYGIAGLAGLYISLPTSVQGWKELAELIQSIATTLGLIIGGIWVYFNFIKQRAYQPRLEPKVTGRVQCRNDVTYLSINYELKSIGYPKTVIGKNSGILIRTAHPSTRASIKDPTAAISIDWERVGFAKAFDKHDWVERDETISGVHLMVLPGCDHLAFRLELTVFGGGHNELEWNAETIIQSEDDECETSATNSNLGVDSDA